MNIFKKIEKVTNVFLFLGATSFIFYFIGLIYNKSYNNIFFTINKINFDGDYQQYVIIGVLQVIIFIFVLPVFINWVESYNQIRKYEKLLKESEEQLLLIKDKNNLKKEEVDFDNNCSCILDLENKLKIYKEIITKDKETFISKNPFSFKNSYNVVTIILYVLSAVISFFINQKTFLAVSARLLLVFIFSLFLFNFIRSYVNKSRISQRLKFEFLFFFFSFFIVFIPYLFGLIDGSVDKYYNNNKINLYTEEQVFNDIKIINSNNNSIIFKYYSKKIYINKADVLRIEECVEK
jgi:uncharacterized membrane protein